jgi:hypothetical protein
MFPFILLTLGYPYGPYQIWAKGMNQTSCLENFTLVGAPRLAIVHLNCTNQIMIVKASNHKTSPCPCPFCQTPFSIVIRQNSSSWYGTANYGTFAGTATRYCKDIFLLDHPALHFIFRHRLYRNPEGFDPSLTRDVACRCLPLSSRRNFKVAIARLLYSCGVGVKIAWLLNSTHFIRGRDYSFSNPDRLALNISN